MMINTQDDVNQTIQQQQQQNLAQRGVPLFLLLLNIMILLRNIKSTP